YRRDGRRRDERKERSLACLREKNRRGRRRGWRREREGAHHARDEQGTDGALASDGGEALLDAGAERGAGALEALLHRRLAQTEEARHLSHGPLLAIEEGEHIASVVRHRSERLLENETLFLGNRTFDRARARGLARFRAPGRMPLRPAAPRAGV